jgi:Arc/MetJ family transcription regulator
MPKVRTTITIDEEVLKAAKVRAAREGKRDGEIIESALRRELGFELFDRLWAENDLSEKEAMDLALEAQRWARRRRR